MKKQLSYAAFAALASVLLVSCGTSSTDTTSLTSYAGDGFSMDVPKSWIEKKASELPTASKGTVALAMTSTDISSGFANNLLVLKDKLSPTETGEKMTSKKYSVVNQALTTGKYEEYVKLNEKEVTFADEDVSNLYVFEAKYNRETPKKRFIQTAKVCDESVYLITVATELNSGATAKYETLAKSFQCKK